MVFNIAAAPKTGSEFNDWFEHQTEWSEDHSYDDPKVTTKELRDWFMEMIINFPALNGPHKLPDTDPRIDEDSITDYSVGSDVIYAAFAWSVADEVYSHALELAAKHNVGILDPQEGKVYMWKEE